MAELRVIRREPADFQDRARDWLLQDEAAHNLLLGVLPALVSGRHSFPGPVYLATIEAEDEVVGCAFRTLPFHLGVTRMPAAAYAPLLESVAEVYDDVSGTIGPPEPARAVAERWAERAGGRAEIAMQQGIYELEEVVWPERMPAGRLRLATRADADLARAWSEAFVRDTGVPAHDVQGLADRFVLERELYFWETDAGTVSMAAATGQTPRGIRIGYVYTPDEARGRGYASALVAQLSQQCLDEGRRLCFLYTDLTNPTSNRIYQRLGYRRVADSVEVRVVVSPAGES